MLIFSLAGIKNLVYTSSATVVIGKHETLLEGIDETKPYPKEHMDLYTSTKVDTRTQVHILFLLVLLFSSVYSLLL